MRIGYARVSTAEQSLDLQLDAFASPNGTRTHCRADQSGAGGGAQPGAGCRPEAPHDAEQDRVSAATPAWRDATSGGSAQPRGIDPHSLSLGAGVKPLRARE